MKLPLWFLLGCLKMYLMWCFYLWEFPLVFSDMSPSDRGVFLFLTLLWGVEASILSTLLGNQDG